MNFLVDAQLSPEIAAWLRSHGHEAAHLSELGLEAATDSSIWALAVDQRAVVITKDRDFFDRAVSGQTPAPPIVWIRTGNLRRREQLEHLTQNWLRILTRLNSADQLIEVR